MEATVIKVLIADDHPVFIEGLTHLINSTSAMKVVGEASNGRELVKLYSATKPDIVLTDILMPGTTGIDATEEIIEKDPDAKIIALSMFDEQKYIVNILDAGAQGYLSKNAPREEIVQAIEALLAGGTYISSSLSIGLIKRISQSKFVGRNKFKKVELSDVEREIVECICNEMTSPEIAEKLHLGIRTVENYRFRLMSKLEVKSKVGIVLFAIKSGIFKV